MIICRALLPVALAMALSISPRLQAGSLQFNDGNLATYTWTAVKIQDTTDGQTAAFNAGETPTGGINGGAYRSNSFNFSYDGGPARQGILIGNLSTNITYSPAISGAISSITGFGIAASNSVSGGTPELSI